MTNDENFQFQMNEENGKLIGGFVALSDEKLSKIKGGSNNGGQCNNKGACPSKNSSKCSNTGGCADAQNTGVCTNYPR